MTRVIGYYEEGISDDDLIAAAEWYDAHVTKERQMTSTDESRGLKFTQLNIQRHEFGTDKGKLRATVKCSRWDTQLDVKIPDDIVIQIMRLIAPAIAAQVNAALLDVSRDHEDWMIGQEAAEAAKLLPEQATD